MPKSSNDSAGTLSWRKKLLFAAFTTVAFFLLLEATLTLLGVQRVTDSGDPFVGFSSQIPLMEPSAGEDGETIVRTARGKLVWFNPQSFSATKPSATRRVFCVGGSTTFGRPFADLTSYCGWLRELLPIVDASTRWEVINAGGVSYASYRVAAVMAELAEYEPDLFIVYSAQNEFLERRTYQGMFDQSRLSRDLKAGLQKTRTWSLVHEVAARLRAPAQSQVEQLAGEVDEMLNHSIGPKDYHRDDAWREKVLRHYEWNLNRMVSIAQNAGAEIVLITPASNLRDCGPFKTESSNGLSDDAVAEAQLQLDLADLQLRDEQFDAALAICQAVLASDGRNAEAHFLAGRALFGMGRNLEAETAFKRAIDEDICPLRATTQIVDAVRRVARQNHVPLVDFENQLRDKCLRELGHGCLGAEYFLDHVHPTIDVHGDLALWILDELQNQKLVGGSTPSEATVRQVRVRIDDQIDVKAQGVAFRNLAKVLHWAGKFQEAAPRARDAIKLIRDDLESRFVLADCLINMGKREEAFQVYEELFAIGEYPRAYLPFGELLIERGDLTAAKAYLLQALLTESDMDRARAHYKLGLAHYRLREFQLAVQSLRAADELYPDDPGTLSLLADALVDGGDVESGIELLRRVIRLDEGNFYAHYRLGMVLLSQNELSDARRQLESAKQIDPTDARVIDALEVVGDLESRESNR